MKYVFALTVGLLSVNAFAQANCTKVAEELAFDQYSSDNYGGHSETSAKAITAKDGSVYYMVTADGDYGTVVYTVIFDDPSCAKDTARIYENKK